MRKFPFDPQAALRVHWSPGSPRKGGEARGVSQPMGEEAQKVGR